MHKRLWLETRYGNEIMSLFKDWYAHARLGGLTVFQYYVLSVILLPLRQLCFKKLEILRIVDF